MKLASQSLWLKQNILENLAIKSGEVKYKVVFSSSLILSLISEWLFYTMSIIAWTISASSNESFLLLKIRKQ